MDKTIKKILKNPLAIKRVNLEVHYDEVPKELALCENLEVLDISYSDIAYIPKFVSKLPKLKSLQMLGCKRLKFPANLKEYSNLKSLGVYSKKGKELDSVFTLKNLETLAISGKLKSVPSTIKNLKYLKKVMFFALPINTLPKGLQELPGLATLEINTGLAKLDFDTAVEILESCPKLTSLKLFTQKLKITPAIAKLSSLKKLDLSGNQLKNIPQELFQLTNLTELDLGINSIKKIPEGIGELKKLKVLKLNSNWSNILDTSNLMNEIHLLENLQILHLWSCQSVKHIPESIKHCKKLRELDLDNNLLKEVPEAFLTMKWLKKLRLTTNKIDLATQNKIVNALPDTKVSVDGEHF